MPNRSWVVGYGTRPEIMKLNAVVAAMVERGASVLRWHTGQHTDLLTATADTPRHAAFVAGSHHMGLDPLPDPAQFAATCADRVHEMLKNLTPQAAGVLVQGDTASAYGVAMGAQRAGVPVIHVEAGVRSGDPSDPWPEERFRIAIDRIASVHFAATEANRQHLEAEGVLGTVWVVGNPGIDDLWRDVVFPRNASRHVLMTFHRRETHQKLPDIMAQLDWLASHHPEHTIVWPVHPNPAVRAAADALEHIHTLPPLGGRAFRRLLAAARLVLTDSGGVQEEAAALGVPCLVARRVTDRPESVEAGMARVVGTDPAGVAQALLDELAHPTLPRTPLDVYGDGLAAGRIAEKLLG